MFLISTIGGGNGFNRYLCAPNNVDAEGCQWGPGAIGKACNSKCPTGYLTLTKNSHIAGQKSGCASGKYAPVCCFSVTETSSTSCYATTADHIFSGSLATRDDTTGITDYTYDLAEDDSDDSTDDETRKRKRRRMEDAHKAVSKRSAGALAKRASSGSCNAGTLPIGAIAVEIPAALVLYRIIGGSYY